MEENYADLGCKLLENYQTRSDKSSILTGPMFSHFIANLVLREVDEFAESLNVEYFRYVDDITIVGDSAGVDAAINKLRHLLDSHGFAVHPIDSPKTLTLSAETWLESSNDFSPEAHSVAWMRLIGDIKKFLIFDGNKVRELEDALFVAGARLPIPDYTEAVKEVSSYKKIRKLGLWN